MPGLRFAKDDADVIHAIISGIEGNTAEQVKVMGITIYAELIKNTPVDTGWARANWTVSLGVPSEDLIGMAKDARHGEVDNLSGPQSARALITYTLDKGQVYITNNVPYIGRLNEGYSKQAPANFIESAIETGVAAAKKA